MKIRRIGVKNYRGLDEQEIELALTGVTVIEAPNEAGKSSLLDAVPLLFERPDSSKHADVRSAQPVGQDVGAEVDVELDMGPYRLAYSKRFHKQPRTTLHIFEPTTEHISGRDAHDRMKAIMAETMDETLWTALWFRQGKELGQPGLAASQSLSQALDLAAGGSAEDMDEGGLFEAVHAEYLRYFNPMRGEKKELTDADKLAADAAAQVEELERKLRDLEADITQSDQLARDEISLVDEIADAEPQVAEYERRERQLGRLQAKIAQRTAEHDAAAGKVEVASGDLQIRTAAVQHLGAAERKVGELDEQLHTSRPSLMAAEAEHIQATTAAERATGAHQDAQRLAELRQGDLNHLRDAAELAGLHTRQQRIDKAVDQAREAERFLARCRVSEQALEAIREAHVELEKARAQLAAGAPSVELEALSTLEPTVDSEPRPLCAGEVGRYTVADRLELELPDLARITVVAGTSADELKRTLAQAEQQLAEACQSAGVQSLDEAREQATQRQSHERQLQDRDRVLEENLDQQTRDELGHVVESLTLRVGAWQDERSAEPPVATDLDQAKDELDQSLHAATTAAALAHERATHLQALTERLEELRTSTRDRVVALKLARDDLEAEQLELAAVREQHSDEQLGEALGDRQAALAQAQAALAQAQDELARSEPEQLELLAQNAKQALEGLRKQLQEVKEKQSGIRSRLQIQGEEGHGEQLEQARQQQGYAQISRDRLRARAAAAQMLHQIMSAERDKARDRYREPLKLHIDQLGRFVFGSDFSVDLDEQLQVSHRTLGGLRLPWDSLSSGAKEQISILTALACAQLVADDGVPVVLDDSLGYTDPARLEKMGAVLNLVGRDCQIIVLTCVGERYRHVGGAQVVRLAQAPNAPSAAAPSA